MLWHLCVDLRQLGHELAFIQTTLECFIYLINGTVLERVQENSYLFFILRCVEMGAELVQPLNYSQFQRGLFRPLFS